MARVIAHELRVFGVHGMAVRHYDALLRAVVRGHRVAGLAGRQDDRARGGGRRARVDGAIRSGGRDGRRPMTDFYLLDEKLTAEEREIRDRLRALLRRAR